MELFKLHGTIDVDNTSANKALDETSDKGQKTQGTLSKVMSGLGKGAAAVGKAVGAGMVVAGTAVAGLATQSIQAYASYEQLVGGVDTLFKQSSGKVQEYARSAYKTAGLSANEYMETVTSFSASLLQSLGGDTEKAADKANTAITDMSDNANKMGTSMEMIQNAYQGFAKQNYTMLDNLKLGYGGTKEEMQRLLADAEKLSGQKFDISSYADVVDAIHVIQTEMGITGTTAAEASATISGSAGSVKAAWQDLMVAFVSDDLSLDTQINNLIASVETMVTNLLPRIGASLDGIVKMIDKVAPIILAKIPELLSQLLPTIISAASALVQQIAELLPELIGVLFSADTLNQLITGFTNIIASLAQALPQILQQIVAVLPSAIQSILQSLVTLVPIIIESLVQMIVTLCQNIGQIIEPIIAILPDLIITIIDALLENLPVLIEGAITLIIGLVDAIPQIIEALVDSIPKIIEMLIVALFECREALINGAIKLVGALVGALPQILLSLSQALPKALLGIWNAAKEIFVRVPEWFAERFNAAVEGIAKAFSGVKNALVKPFNWARDKIKEVADKIKGFFKGEISMPKIKLPHFGITPSGWKIGDLLKGSIPKLKVDWYAEAMRNPMIMTKPTVFGYDAGTGKLLGGGEAGSEVVSGTSTLMNMIASAVASQNSALVYYLQRIIEILADYFPQLLEAFDMDVVLNDGVLVGRLAPAMDAQLGIIRGQKERGR